VPQETRKLSPLVTTSAAGHQQQQRVVRSLPREGLEGCPAAQRVLSVPPGSQADLEEARCGRPQKELCGKSGTSAPSCPLPCSTPKSLFGRRPVRRATLLLLLPSSPAAKRGTARARGGGDVPAREYLHILPLVSHDGKVLNSKHRVAKVPSLPACSRPPLEETTR